MAKSQTQFVGTIPAGKDKVFVQLAADADIDLKLVAADGTVMLQYVSQNNWIGGCVTCTTTTVSSYSGMTLTSCVDKCSADLTLTVSRLGTLLVLVECPLTLYQFSA